MTEQSKQARTGEANAPVTQEESATDQNAGELTIEELTKVAGGLRRTSTLIAGDLAPKPIIMARRKG